MKVETLAPNSCLRPFTLIPRSLSWPCQPYSLCISKMRAEAWPPCKTPTKSSRVRKVLPVPLLPNTPIERLTNSFKSRHSLVSMSKGFPTQKLPLSSLPKTNSTSRWEAAKALEKVGRGWSWPPQASRRSPQYRRHGQLGKHRYRAEGDRPLQDTGHERVIVRERCVLQSGIGATQANVGHDAKEPVFRALNADECSNFDLLHRRAAAQPYLHAVGKRTLDHHAQVSIWHLSRTVLSEVNGWQTHRVTLRRMWVEPRDVPGQFDRQGTAGERQEVSGIGL